jgi:hypothetical protein
MATSFFEKIKLQTLALPDKSGRKSIGVNFANRGLRRVITRPTSLREATPDKANIRQMSRLLSRVKMKPRKPTSFQSIQEFVGADYIGYILEKQRLDQNTGNWIPIDEYWLIGSSIANFKDSRVAYGNIYRYRMKSVISVTFRKKKVSYENIELVEDVARREKELIKKRMKSRLSALANIDRITNLGLEKKISSGRASKTFDLLKNLKIKSNSRRTEVVKRTRMPTEFKNFRRLKRLRVKDLDIVRGSVSQEQLQKEINSKLRTVEEDIIEYESFYFESRPSRNWVIVDVSEKIPPPPPSAIKITPKSGEADPEASWYPVVITWLPPANSQQDIAGFRLYKRNPVAGRGNWELEADLRLEQNIFVGRYSKTWPAIFALTCVDIHGMESFLSTQIQVEFNPNFAIEKKEKDLKWISGSGAKPNETNTIFKTFIEPQDPIIAKESVSFRVKPQFNEEDKKLFVRITSLDTHEKKEFDLTLRNVNLSDEEER